MKHLLPTTIAALVLVGCKPNISIHKAAAKGNIEAVKQHIAAGTDVNAKDVNAKDVNAKDVKGKDVKGKTPLGNATIYGHKEIV